MSSPLKQEQDILESAASKLISLAINSGVDAAEVCGSWGEKIKITLEKQDFQLASSDSGYQLGLRVLKNGQQGFASTNSIETADLKQIASRAVEIAKFSRANPNQRIPTPKSIALETKLGLWDEGLSHLSLKTQQEWAQLLGTQALKDPRFRLNEASVETYQGISLIQNSLGVHQVEPECHASWSMMGMASEGETITSFDYFGALSRLLSGTEKKLVSTVRNFTQSVVATLKQGPASSYQGLVVFSPRAVADIFLDGLMYHLNGRVVAEKTGKWTRANLEKMVLNEQFTLKDLPHVAGRWGASTFDREGMPTFDRALIEKGSLKGFLLDSYAATALEMASTGNAAGGASTTPTVGAHTLSLGKGNLSKAKLFDAARGPKNEFLVVHRFSGQVDPVTGDFSGVAKGAEWWKNSERAYFATETLISGNVFECLGKSLVALSEESVVVDDGTDSPYVLCDGVSVTGSKQ